MCEEPQPCRQAIAHRSRHRSRPDASRSSACALRVSKIPVAGRAASPRLVDSAQGGVLPLSSVVFLVQEPQFSVEPRVCLFRHSKILCAIRGRLPVRCPGIRAVRHGKCAAREAPDFKPIMNQRVRCRGAVGEGVGDNVALALFCNRSSPIAEAVRSAASTSPGSMNCHLVCARFAQTPARQSA